MRTYDADTDGVLNENNDGDHYYTHDANFNVTAVVSATGTVLERYHYTPYGGLEILDASFGGISSSTIESSHTYTGQIMDAETMVYQFRNRDYSCHLGLFLSRDPIEYVGGSGNLYGYVTSQPTVATDPYGLQQYGYGRFYGVRRFTGYRYDPYSGRFNQVWSYGGNRIGPFPHNGTYPTFHHNPYYNPYYNRNYNNPFNNNLQYGNGRFYGVRRFTGYRYDPYSGRFNQVWSYGGNRIGPFPHNGRYPTFGTYNNHYYNNRFNNR